MQGSRIVLALGAVVVLVYAALTAWPAIEALLRGGASARTASARTAPALPSNVASARRHAATGNPAPPFKPRPGVPSQQPPATTALAPPPTPLQQRRQNSHVIDLGHMSTYASWTYDSSIVRYASRDVEMLNRPGGNGLPPVSLNHAPLVVLRGTRLLPMEERGEWVMVRSLSNTLGWVRKSELSDRRAYSRAWND